MSATAVVKVLAAPPALVNVIVGMLSGQHSVLHTVAFATPSCSQPFFIFAEAA